jgi:hypothetical protein
MRCSTDIYWLSAWRGAKLLTFPERPHVLVRSFLVVVHSVDRKALLCTLYKRLGRLVRCLKFKPLAETVNRHDILSCPVSSEAGTDTGCQNSWRQEDAVVAGTSLVYKHFTWLKLLTWKAKGRNSHKAKFSNYYPVGVDPPLSYKSKNNKK